MRGTGHSVVPDILVPDILVPDILYRSKTAEKSLLDLGFRQRLYNATSRALELISGESDKAAELRFLMAALQKMGI